MLVDSEAVLARLKQRLQEKDSWGRRELQSVIIELEAESLVDAGLLPNTLRQYGVFLSTDLLSAGKTPATVIAAGAHGDGDVIPTSAAGAGEHNGELSHRGSPRG